MPNSVFLKGDPSEESQKERGFNILNSLLCESINGQVL